MQRLSKNGVAIAGEFAVLSQLALRGFDANVTLGNTKSVDILAAEPDHQRVLKLEVKTSFAIKPRQSTLFGRCLHWVMSDRHERIAEPLLFYVFVHIEQTTNFFRFFIVHSSDVASYVKDQHTFWLGQRSAPLPKTPMRIFRIALDNDRRRFPSPLASEHENRWDFPAPNAAGPLVSPDRTATPTESRSRGHYKAGR
jgi:hypothetical protein